MGAHTITRRVKKAAEKSDFVCRVYPTHFVPQQQAITPDAG